MQDDPEFNIRFVGIIETQRCLYDITDKNYHLSHIQEKAWNEVANEIGEGATVQECKTKWRNIRGRFTKSLKAYTPSGSGVAPKRPYYMMEYMSFLTPFTKSRRPKGNIQLPSKIVPESRLIKKEDDLDHNEEVISEEYLDEDADISQLSIQVTDNIQESLETPSTSRKRSSNTNFTQHAKKMRKSNSTNITIDEVNKSAFDYFSQKTGKQFDADSHFLMSLSPDMKRMTESQKREFKISVLSTAGEILGESGFLPDQPLPTIAE